MIGYILISFLLQVLFTVGLIVLFGFIIAFINKTFYANFGSHARTVCYATGFVGTPIHELSHALFCVLFGHKIVEIKWFQINSDDGTLGYVNHTYNPSNFYQNLGNFFIGVAPIIVISAVLYIASYLLLPVLSVVIVKLSGELTLGDWGAFFTGLGKTFIAFFSLASTWQWWVFLAIGLMLCLHMTLSGADIHGAMSGLIFVLAGLLVADFVLGYINSGLLASFTQVIMRISSFLLCFFTLALMLALIALAISFVYRLIASRR